MGHSMTPPSSNPVDFSDAQYCLVFELPNDGDQNAINARRPTVLAHETFSLLWLISAGDEGLQI
jgi:hypothetical protein